MAEASTEIALASFFYPEAQAWATKPTFGEKNLFSGKEN